MIELNNISAGYNGKNAIRDINITFPRGQIISIIGKNGCGKTTLLKVSANQLQPYQGDVFIDKKSILAYERKELAQKISFLPQIRAIPPISVKTLVLHGRFPYLSFPRTPIKKDMDIVANSLKAVGLWEYRNKDIHELSGGERQKAYIAMVLSQDTDIIFLDEPTTYLDMNHQLEIIELIKTLKSMGKTIIMVIHDISLALCHSDSICLMNKGKIVMHDHPQLVYESKEIETVFDVKCKPFVHNNVISGYIFTLK